MTGTGGASASATNGKSSKKAKKEEYKDFSIEYAKSGRAACKICEKKIPKVSDSIV